MIWAWENFYDLLLQQQPRLFVWEKRFSWTKWNYSGMKISNYYLRYMSVSFWIIYAIKCIKIMKIKTELICNIRTTKILQKYHTIWREKFQENFIPFCQIPTNKYSSEKSCTWIFHHWQKKSFFWFHDPHEQTLWIYICCSFCKYINLISSSSLRSINILFYMDLA